MVRYPWTFLSPLWFVICNEILRYQKLQLNTKCILFVSRMRGLLFLHLINLLALVTASDILMITMGGTKSHKIPFWELARGLIGRQHNVTFLNGFLADFTLDGLHEITPAGLVNYIQNYTQNWDLVGARMRGDLPISLWDAIRYPLEVSIWSLLAIIEWFGVCLITSATRLME